MSENGLWTIDQLSAGVVEALAADYPGQTNGRVRAVPDRRTIRWYTTIGLLDRPAAMRGRTALYDRRHLLQLVAIKRLQSEGHTLAAVQEQLLGATTPTLETIARLPQSAPTPPPAPIPPASPATSAAPTPLASATSPAAPDHPVLPAPLVTPELSVTPTLFITSAPATTPASPAPRKARPARELAAPAHELAAPAAGHDAAAPRSPQFAAPMRKARAFAPQTAAESAPQSDAPASEVTTSAEARERFWAAAPGPVSAPVHGMRLGPGVTLLLDAAHRAPSATEMAAIEAAARPLLDMLRQLGLDANEEGKP